MGIDNGPAILAIEAYAAALGIDVAVDTAAPTLTAVSAANISEGDTLVITGDHLLSVSSVTIGGTAATDVKRMASNRLSCVVPAGSGTVDVVVTNSYGSDTLPAAVTYVTPAITSIAIDNGETFAEAGDTLTLTGYGLATVTAGTYGGVAATVAVVSSTEVTMTVPLGATPEAGASSASADYAVTLDHATGTATDTLTTSFVFDTAYESPDPNASLSFVTSGGTFGARTCQAWLARRTELTAIRLQVAAAATWSCQVTGTNGSVTKTGVTSSGGVEYITFTFATPLIIEQGEVFSVTTTPTSGNVTIRYDQSGGYNDGSSVAYTVCSTPTGTLTQPLRFVGNVASRGPVQVFTSPSYPGSTASSGKAAMSFTVQTSTTRKLVGIIGPPRTNGTYPQTVKAQIGGVDAGPSWLGFNNSTTYAGGGLLPFDPLPTLSAGVPITVKYAFTGSSISGRYNSSGPGWTSGVLTVSDWIEETVLAAQKYVFTNDNFTT